MKKYDRSAIMRRAHELKPKVGWSLALKQVWADAKSSKVPALPPQRLPLEAVVCDAYALARRLTKVNIKAGLRIRVDVGVSVNDRQWVKSAEASALYQNAQHNRLEAR